MPRPHATDTYRNADDRRRVRRLGALATVAALIAIGSALAVADGQPGALIPLPSSTAPTTTTPRPITTRPALPTTTTVAGTVPRPSTTLPAPTTTIAPAQPTTSGPQPGTSAPAAAPTTGPIPAPPANTDAPPDSSSSTDAPATSEPQTAPFVMSSPVIVDPEDPAVQPPVIVQVAIYCINGVAGANVLVQNVDPYHYPKPFEAFYDWELADGSSIVDDGSFQLAAWDLRIVNLGQFLAAQELVFTIVDTDLDVSAAAEVVIPDCSTLPAPSIDPLPPLVVVPSVACAEDFGADQGNGAFTFTVQNEAADDGSNREYEFNVMWVDAQLLVDDGQLGSLASTQWADHDVVGLHSGTYMIEVSDVADPNLGAFVSVEVPPCAPDVPPAEPVPPLNAPTIVNVTTQCADPVVLDGRADFFVHNNNYQVLGGTGELVYDWTLSLGSAVIESASGYYFGTPGLYQFFEQPLAPGEYTATIAVTDFPELADSATFTIYDCSGPQPDHGLVIISGTTTMCFPGDDTEALLFFVDHYAQPEAIAWSIVDGANTVVGLPEVHLDGSLGNALSARHVPAGTYDLVVVSLASPDALASTPIEIGTCTGPADPVDPTDPVDPADPVDPTDPVDPVDPSAPVDPTQPSEPSVTPSTVTETAAAATTGTLPATGTPVVTVAVVALLVVVSGVLTLLAARRPSG